MAFMVPLVKNHYDIYARNGSPEGVGGRDTGSLYLSATSVKSGGATVTKQYRIVINGGKMVANGSAGSKRSITSSSNSLKNRATQSVDGKIYYRMPSASISLPVRAQPFAAPKPLSSGSDYEAATKKSTKDTATCTAEHQSPSGSPTSRPVPHVRRTVRNPITNRVYSYSVSIPDYVAEEDEEELEDEEDIDEEVDEGIDLENKLSNSQLLLFSTSAPAGTGPIDNVHSNPLPMSESKKRPPQQQFHQQHRQVPASLSLPTSPITDSIILPANSRLPSLHHQRTHSTTSTSTTAVSSTANSREYVELLRKFIFHLKMLRIGGSKAKRMNKNSNVSNSTGTDTNKPRRKRKDTMEDSKHL